MGIPINPLLDPYSGAYVYVNGRPLVLLDPLGLSPWDYVKAATSSGGNFVAVATFGDNDESVLAPQDAPQPGADQVLVVDEQHGDLGSVHVTIHTTSANEPAQRRPAECRRTPTIRRPTGRRR